MDPDSLVVIILLAVLSGLGLLGLLYYFLYKRSVFLRNLTSSLSCFTKKEDEEAIRPSSRSSSDNEGTPKSYESPTHIDYAHRSLSGRNKSLAARKSSARIGAEYSIGRRHGLSHDPTAVTQASTAHHSSTYLDTSKYGIVNNVAHQHQVLPHGNSIRRPNTSQGIRQPLQQVDFLPNHSGLSGQAGRFQTGTTGVVNNARPEAGGQTFGKSDFERVSKTEISKDFQWRDLFNENHVPNSLPKNQSPAVIPIEPRNLNSIPTEGTSKANASKIKRQLSFHKHLILGVDATPRKIGGFIINPFKNQVQYYSLHSNEMPWVLRNRTRTGNPTEFEMKNFLCSLILWHDLIIAKRQVEIYTDNSAIIGKCEYGQRVRDYLRHLTDCQGVKIINPDKMYVNRSNHTNEFKKYILPADSLSRGRIDEFEIGLKKRYNDVNFQSLKFNKVRNRVDFWTNNQCLICGFQVRTTGSFKRHRA